LTVVEHLRIVEIALGLISNPAFPQFETKLSLERADLAWQLPLSMHEPKSKIVHRKLDFR